MSKTNRGGSALIVVIWIVGMLAVIIGSFSFDAHIEARITSYYRKRAKAENLARSGVEIARMLMVKSTQIKSNPTPMGDKPSEDRWYDAAKTLSDGLPVRGQNKVVEALGDGTILVEIESEQGRWNINRLAPTETNAIEVLERILDVGGVPDELWPVLIESYLDWTDPDSAARENGAETEDYYSILPSPYRARNGPLDDVEELLQVKGYSRAILYGGQLSTGKVTETANSIPGIHDLLTVYGDGKVNVNTASERVLMTLPNVDAITARAIIEERRGLTAAHSTDQKNENTSFKSVSDLYARIPDLEPNVAAYVTTASAYYRVTSVGVVGGVQYKVWAVVKFEQNGNMLILRWREND